MKEDHAVFKKKVQAYQMTILVMMVIVTVFGGCVFGLGVKTRPILRITKPELFHYVEWILDMMIATGLCQIATAGFSCFAICWKLIWPIYFAIGTTAMNVILDLSSIGTSLHLLHTSEELANEDVVHPWYWVECQIVASCHDALLAYVYYFVLPQIFFTSVALCLQCLGILYMGRMVRTVAEHSKILENYKEWYKEHLNDHDETVEKVNNKGIEMTSLKEQIKKPSEDGAEKNRKSPEITYNNPNFHTPSSILKTDHGYVAASGGSLDYLDASPEMRNRKEKEKLTSTPSISFKANVEVHYYDQLEKICSEDVPITSPN